VTGDEKETRTERKLTFFDPAIRGGRRGRQKGGANGRAVKLAKKKRQGNGSCIQTAWNLKTEREGGGGQCRGILVGGRRAKRKKKSHAVLLNWTPEKR